MTTPREPVPLTGDLEIDRAIAELTAQAARIEEMTERVAEVRGHGRAANGQVEGEVLHLVALGLSDGVSIPFSVVKSFSIAMKS